MLRYLMHLSDTTLFLVLSSFFIIVSILAVVLLRQFFPHSFRYKDNAVLGNVASLIGIIYGVLAGLTALYLINNITAAGDAVQQEANAAANLYRDTIWVSGPAKVQIQNEIAKYLSQVINADWKVMSAGEKVNTDGDKIIENLISEILTVNFVGVNQSMIGRDMLQEPKALYNARQMRIGISYQALSAEIWEVILIGTFLTLSINYLFKLGFYLHIVSVTAAGLMAASMIYLLITLDKPFQGDFVVTPEPLENVLHLIQTHEVETANIQTPHHAGGSTQM